MSNRRRIPHPAAHLDGTTLKDSCCRTELSVTRVDGVHVSRLHHDSDCGIFAADAGEQAMARILCHLALQSVLGRKAVSVVIG